MLKTPGSPRSRRRSSSKCRTPTFRKSKPRKPIPTTHLNKSKRSISTLPASPHSLSASTRFPQPSTSSSIRTPSSPLECPAQFSTSPLPRQKRFLSTSLPVGGFEMRRAGAARGMTVILAGFNSFFAQHLYEPLLELGFNVVPIARNPSRPNAAVRVLGMEQISSQGLPDVDFVINCAASNIYAGPYGDFAKKMAEESRLSSSTFWADEIRKAQVKPYALLQISSAFYYPDSELKEYTEEYVLPSPPEAFETIRPELQAQELSLPYWSRLFRNVEHRARVFRPEIDISTAQQQKEYEAQLAALQQSSPLSTSTPDDADLASFQSLPNGHSGINPNPNLDVFESLPDRDTLTNQTTRVINLRHGHLLAHTMQEHALMYPYLDRGMISHIGTGTTIHPWIHIDDAVNLTIHSLLTPSINGPINAVAPTYATNKEIVNFIIKSNRTFTHRWGIKPSTVDKRAGLLSGSLFYNSRKVKPQKALDTGFVFQFPTINDAVKNGLRSNLDEQVLQIGGFDNLPRNQSRRLDKRF